jgi:hypothetical protein
VTSPIKWWRQPDHYDWISGYRQARRMTPLTRAMVALTAAALGIAPLAMLAGSHPPSSPSGWPWRYSPAPVRWVAHFCS